MTEPVLLLVAGSILASGSGLITWAIRSQITTHRESHIELLKRLAEAHATTTAISFRQEQILSSLSAITQRLDHINGTVAATSARVTVLESHEASIMKDLAALHGRMESAVAELKGRRPRGSD